MTASTPAPHVFLTGATGLVGRATLVRLLRADPRLSATVLVRSPLRPNARSHYLSSGRVRVMEGDVSVPGLGLSANDRLALRRRVTHVVHAAADTRFSQSLPLARRVNTAGTAHVIDALFGASLERFVFVSTAFVAGTMTGEIPEGPHVAVPGWINAYERSKYEAEDVVRASGLPSVIARPSTIVCDDAQGRVSQFNAVHRALRLFHSGLAAMLPGSDESLVDVVTTQYVAKALEVLTLEPLDLGDSNCTTVHLCAGDGALPLGEMLDRSRAVWAHSARWRARGIERPSITALETYRLFERSVEETGDLRIQAITRGLSSFVPQLAYPKRFVTGSARRLLGRDAVSVSVFWDRLCRHLTTSRWAAGTRRAG